MAVSKRLRYEILRRDNHACRYCGQMSPEVQLTVDHVVPVALGGSDEASNLATACADCNAGKSSSAPDQEVVADVEQDALRWRAAMLRAEAQAIDEGERRREWRQQFLDYWRDWTIGGKRVDLPSNWRTSLDQFYGSGVTQAEIKDAIEIAMTGRFVKDEFTYTLGILRNLQKERVAVARALLASETPGESI